MKSGHFKFLTFAIDNSFSIGCRLTLRAFSESPFNSESNKTTLSFLHAPQKIWKIDNRGHWWTSVKMANYAWIRDKKQGTNRLQTRLWNKKVLPCVVASIDMDRVCHHLEKIYWDIPFYLLFFGSNTRLSYRQFGRTCIPTQRKQVKGWFQYIFLSGDKLCL